MNKKEAIEKKKGMDKTCIQAAAEDCANDMDLDIPVDDNCKNAIRWLLTEAFLRGYETNFGQDSF